MNIQICIRSKTRATMFALLLAASMSAAHAQTNAPKKDEDIAVVDDFKGSVMVLKDKDYVNALKNMKLFDGDRVLVLDKSEAVVYVTTRGQRCRIELKENQSFTVRDRECRALLLTVQSVPVGTVPGGVAVASSGPLVGTSGALVGVGAVGVAAIIGWQHNKASGD